MSFVRKERVIVSRVTNIRGVNEFENVDGHYVFSTITLNRISLQTQYIKARSIPPVVFVVYSRVLCSTRSQRSAVVRVN